MEVRCTDEQNDIWAVFQDGQQISPDFGFESQAISFLQQAASGEIQAKIVYTLPAIMLICKPGKVVLRNSAEEELFTWTTDRPQQFAKALEQLLIAMQFEDYTIVDDPDNSL